MEPSVSLRSQQIQAVATAFLRRRPLIVGPPAALLVLLFWRTGMPAAQLSALATVKGSMVAFFLWEAWRYRRRPISQRGLLVSLGLTLIGVALACGLSGGIRSPLLPLLFAPSGLALAAFGTRRAGATILALLVIVSATLAAVSAVGLWPPPAPVAAIIAGCATVVVTALLLAVGIVGLVGAYEQAGWQLGQMRAEVVAESAARPREIEALGARLAHEIKNPLTALKGLVQLEARGVTADSSRRRFAIMEGEVARLEQILHDYLSFSRPPSDLRPQAIAGRALLHDVVAVLEGRADERGVALMTSGEDVVLDADLGLLKQALFNLLANAIEATPPGGQVTARLHATPDGPTIEIIDTGPGMDARILAQLGTPFFTTREGGTGLGVVIARRIARQHGGELAFDSRPGAGTTARLRLPAVAARASS